jgi:uncharacterized protein YbcC (UPF0753/DUF2309 family)
MNNVLNYIISLFIPSRPRLRKYSTTLTSATEGFDIMDPILKGIRALVKSVKKKDNISVEDLDKITGHYFKDKKINFKYHKLNKYIRDNLMLEIVSINMITDRDNDVEDILITLKDASFESSLTIIVSVKDINEICDIMSSPSTKEKVSGG